MKTERPKTGRQGLLVNRQLKEWNDNVALENEARYALNGQHKIQRNLLAMAGGDKQQRAELVARQTQEIQELKRQQEATRTSIRQRHLQEKAAIPEDDKLDQKINNIFKFYSSLSTRRK